ncbi:MAG TPA: tetratricopeptide repeat protein, partial [Blastocatellia bacterium]|nr:tetratricopeptide repeat protein [Blastocatellia bacterium]
MMLQNLKLFFELYYRPLHALSGILDKGSLLFGAIAATFVAILFQFNIATVIYHSYEVVPVGPHRILSPQVRPASFQFDSINLQAPPLDDEAEDTYVPPDVYRPLPLVGELGWWFVSFRPMSYYTIVLSLAMLYVPAILILLAWSESGVSVRMIFQRDYAALLACTMMCWAASHLPVLFVPMLGAIIPQAAFYLWLIATLYFGVLMVAAVRIINGASFLKASVIVIVSGIVMGFDSWLYRIAMFSPFLTIIWIAPLALGAFAALTAAYRQRQRFRHNLEASTVNPRDAEAHYQLGLLHLQRRQFAEAAESFKRATEIDPRETDAQFHLGRIARMQGNLQEAINRFSQVVEQDDRHAQSEIWREVGATYLAAAMYQEALDALEKYIERRPFDPEGLYYLGETLKKMGETGRANEAFQQCIEAVNTMPYYRRGQVSHWSKLAEEQLAAR